MFRTDTRLSPASLLHWPWLAVAWFVVGLILLGVPEDFEGPTLFNVPDDFARPTPIDTGTKHGFTLSNGLALVALVIGGLLLLTGAWLNRAVVVQSARRRPRATRLLVIQLALGFTLIFVSGTSTVLRWWAPGTLLIILALCGMAQLVRETLIATPDG